MDSRVRRQVIITLGLIYFFSMFIKGVFEPFITVFLSDKGLSVDLIGVVTGINSVVIILTQPLWGILSDRVGSAKRALAISLAGEALLALSLVVSSGFLPLALAFSCFTVFTAASAPLMDAWNMRSAEAIGDGNGAGKMRLWGCVGYALSSVAAGLFISQTSVASIVPIYAVVVAVLAVALMLIKDSAQVGNGSGSFKGLNLGRILKDKAFFAFLVYVFFMQITHRGSFTFYVLLIEKLGGSASMVGFSSALMFVAQAVVMIVLKRLLKRIKPIFLVMYSSLFFVAWFVLMGFATQAWQVVVSCLLDGPSFALFTMGTLYYIQEIAPSEIRTTYQTVAYSVYFGLSGIVGNTVCGFVIERLGYQAMYVGGAALTLLSTVVFLLWFRKNAGQGKKELAA